MADLRLVCFLNAGRQPLEWRLHALLTHPPKPTSQSRLLRLLDNAILHLGQQSTIFHQRDLPYKQPSHTSYNHQPYPSHKSQLYPPRSGRSSRHSCHTPSIAGNSRSKHFRAVEPDWRFRSRNGEFARVRASCAEEVLTGIVDMCMTSLEAWSSRDSWLAVKRYCLLVRDYNLTVGATKASGKGEIIDRGLQANKLLSLS